MAKYIHPCSTRVNKGKANNKYHKFYLYFSSFDVAYMEDRSLWMMYSCDVSRIMYVCVCVAYQHACMEEKQ